MKLLIFKLILIPIIVQAAAEDDIVVLEKKITEINSTISDNNNKIISSQNKINEIKKIIDAKKIYLAKRIMAYRHIQKFNWQTLFSSPENAIIDRNLKIFKNINNSDLISIEELKLKQSELKYQKDQILLENKSLAQAISELKILEEKLIQFELLKMNELKNLQAEKDSFLVFKYKLSLPLEAELSLKFGSNFDKDIQFNLNSKGIEFKSMPNTNVRAFGPGEVIFSDQIPYWGNSLIISHKGGYYTVYSGLQYIKVKLDDFVEQNQIIAQTSEVPLYFELRHHETPINPLKWIRK